MNGKRHTPEQIIHMLPPPRARTAGGHRCARPTATAGGDGNPRPIRRRRTFGRTATAGGHPPSCFAEATQDLSARYPPYRRRLRRLCRLKPAVPGAPYALDRLEARSASSAPPNNGILRCAQNDRGSGAPFACVQGELLPS